MEKEPLYDMEEYDTSPNYLPIGTILLIVINFLVFIYTDLICFSHEEIFQSYGESYLPILQKGQWYRLLTSQFLHLDINHFLNNAIVLFAIGQYLEKYLGHLWFLIVYFFSGILAGITSMVYYMMLGDPTLSVGASGAVFGLLGGFCAALILIGKKQGTFPLRQILVLGVFSLYCSSVEANVNNAAHIGGFVFGFLLCLIRLYNKPIERTLFS